MMRKKLFHDIRDIDLQCVYLQVTHTGVCDALTGTGLLLSDAPVGLRLPMCSSCPPRGHDGDNKRTLASCLIMFGVCSTDP